MLTRSSWLKALVAAVAGVVVVWFFQATMFDAQYVSAPLDLIESRFDPSAPPSPGARLAFAATAYCKGQLTFSGVNVQRGVTAADPALLPIGSVVQLDLKDDRYTGIYTVLADGDPVRACLIFAVQADGLDITTIEGVAPAPGELSVVQDAFCEMHGMQCGYCTPGMVLTAHALLKHNAAPTRVSSSPWPQHR